jgi:hypothetical protein
MAAHLEQIKIFSTTNKYNCILICCIFDNLHHIVTQTVHHYKFLLVISEVLMGVNIKNMVFWDMTPCRLANNSNNLEESLSSISLCSEDGSRRLLRKRWQLSTKLHGITSQNSIKISPCTLLTPKTFTIGNLVIPVLVHKHHTMNMNGRVDVQFFTF